ncbi:MAG: putative manganese-dependent inorganic diphosphatase [Bacilli bacterium]|nr:putative manganese-dependent inorganic diphosphatase [Bacilli bacterium]
MKTTYIFGHKIPDTDAVCASISLSYLKNKLGYKTEPRVLGAINRETKFVLDYFNVKEPEFLNDVKVRIRDMQYVKDAMIEEHLSIASAYEKMSVAGVTGFPVVDKHRKLKGYVNVKEISKYLIEGDVTSLKTSYDNIVETLGAIPVLKFDEEIEGHILAAAYKSDTFLNRVKLDTNDILLVSDRVIIQEYAIDSCIKLLILVNNVSLSEELLEKAKKNRVNVITVPLGTFKTSNMIKLCNYITSVDVHREPVLFTDSDYRDDFVTISSKLGHTNYPVVNGKNYCIGMLRLIDINNYEKTKVILVDHNSEDQSVDGLEEADILEIIDHHNLGNLGTTRPISFRSMPVGCTSTIITQLYKEAHVEIPKDMAGIMLSAILSDTLLFKSPTVTDLDKEVAKELADIAGVNIEEYGFKMFKAGSSIAGMSVDEIIHSDLKTYKIDNGNLAIAQVMTLDYDEIDDKIDEFVAALNRMSNLGGFKHSILFVTDVIKNGCYIYYNDDSKDLVKEAFRLDDIEEGYYLDGIVSRKKQILPALLEIVK